MIVDIPWNELQTVLRPSSPVTEMTLYLIITPTPWFCCWGQETSKSWSYQCQITKSINFNNHSRHCTGKQTKLSNKRLMTTTHYWHLLLSQTATTMYTHLQPVLKRLTYRGCSLYWSLVTLEIGCVWRNSVLPLLTGFWRCTSCFRSSRSRLK